MTTITTPAEDASRVARPIERRDWLVQYVRENGTADILDAAFVEEYIEATGASFRPTPFGALRCPTLGRDLSRLNREGRLDRRRCGVSFAEQGFPKWVYIYTSPGGAR